MVIRPVSRAGLRGAVMTHSTGHGWMGQVDSQRRRDWGGLSRRGLLVGAVGAVGCGLLGPLPRALYGEVAAACRSGAGALWALQAEHGGLPSPVVGLLRPGHATTALALDALLGLPSGWRQAPPGAIDRAEAFLLAARDDRGALGRPGGTTEYPVYATALALKAMARRRRRGDSAWDRTVVWLRSQQLLSGWEDHGAYGGFPLGGAAPTPPNAGHVDLSMTRVAIEALSMWAPGDRGWADAAGRFARRCRVDGGFVYAPVDLPTNKAGCAGAAASSCRAYGSATADGLLSLLALGGGSGDPDLVAAHRALLKRHRVDVNPGLEDGPMAAFAPAMRFYYRAVAARVFAVLGGPDGWRGTVCRALVSEQGRDGTWRNESGLQKEDCPVVATSLALLALSAASG